MAKETYSPDRVASYQQQNIPTPSKDTDHIYLRRGDLVRISDM